MKVNHSYKIILGRVILFCSWFLVMGSASARAADALPFKEGEKLTYHFYWGIFMVGRGTFEVQRDSSGGYVFEVRGKSNDIISAIYPVEEAITSFFDPRFMRSTRFQQDRKEDGDHTWEETFFFYSFGLGSTQSYVSGETKWFEIPKKAVQDKLSTIYFMRCQDWDQQNEHSVVLGNDKQNYEVRIKKLKAETIKLDDFSAIPTFKVEPNTEYLGGFVKKGRMWAWVSNDRFKVPIRVVAKLPVGTVSAELVAVKGIDDWPYTRRD